MAYRPGTAGTDRRYAGYGVPAQRPTTVSGVRAASAGTQRPPTTVGAAVPSSAVGPSAVAGAPHRSYTAAGAGAAGPSGHSSARGSEGRTAPSSSSSSSAVAAASAPAPTSIAHYMIGRTLGQGTFGKVKLGTHILTGERVAIKILEKARIREVADVTRVTREIKILKRVSHPNVTRLYEVLDTPSHILLVMELVDSGELFGFIVKHGSLSEAVAARLFAQLVDGIDYLHSVNVCHRDLKPENILLQRMPHRGADHDSQLAVKIIDFGLSNTFDDGRYLKTACGSPAYAPPEMIQRLPQGYDPRASDIWSLGVVLFAMVSGCLPFEHDNTAKLYDLILNARYKPPASLSAGCRDLIARILVTDPRRRITAEQIRHHPWLRVAFGSIHSGSNSSIPNPRSGVPPAGGSTSALSAASSPGGALAAASVATRQSLFEAALRASDPQAVPSSSSASAAVRIRAPRSVTDLLPPLADAVEAMGIEREYLYASIRKGAHNHATAAYHLLLQQVDRRGDLDGMIAVLRANAAGAHKTTARAPASTESSTVAAPQAGHASRPSSARPVVSSAAGGMPTSATRSTSVPPSRPGTAAPAPSTAATTAADTRGVIGSRTGELFVDEDEAFAGEGAAGPAGSSARTRPRTAGPARSGYAGDAYAGAAGPPATSAMRSGVVTVPSPFQRQSHRREDDGDLDDPDELEGGGILAADSTLRSRATDTMRSGFAGAGDTFELSATAHTRETLHTIADGDPRSTRRTTDASPSSQSPRSLSTVTATTSVTAAASARVPHLNLPFARAVGAEASAAPDPRGGVSAESSGSRAPRAGASWEEDGMRETAKAARDTMPWSARGVEETRARRPASAYRRYAAERSRSRGAGGVVPAGRESGAGGDGRNSSAASGAWAARADGVIPPAPPAPTTSAHRSTSARPTSSYGYAAQAGYRRGSSGGASSDGSEGGRGRSGRDSSSASNARQVSWRGGVAPRVPEVDAVPPVSGRSRSVPVAQHQREAAAAAASIQRGSVEDAPAVDSLPAPSSRWPGATRTSSSSSSSRPQSARSRGAGMNPPAPVVPRSYSDRPTTDEADEASAHHNGPPETRPRSASHNRAGPFAASSMAGAVASSALTGRGPALLAQPVPAPPGPVPHPYALGVRSGAGAAAGGGGGVAGYGYVPSSGYGRRARAAAVANAMAGAYGGGGTVEDAAAGPSSVSAAGSLGSRRSMTSPRGRPGTAGSMADDGMGLGPASAVGGPSLLDGVVVVTPASPTTDSAVNTPGGRARAEAARSGGPDAVRARSLSPRAQSLAASGVAESFDPHVVDSAGMGAAASASDEDPVATITPPGVGQRAPVVVPIRDGDVQVVRTSDGKSGYVYHRRPPSAAVSTQPSTTATAPAVSVRPSAWGSGVPGPAVLGPASEAAAAASASASASAGGTWAANVIPHAPTTGASVPSRPAVRSVGAATEQAATEVVDSAPMRRGRRIVPSVAAESTAADSGARPQTSGAARFPARIALRGGSVDTEATTEARGAAVSGRAWADNDSIRDRSGAATGGEPVQPSRGPPPRSDPISRPTAAALSSIRGGIVPQLPEEGGRTSQGGDHPQPETPTEGGMYGGLSTVVGAAPPPAETSVDPLPTPASARGSFSFGASSNAVPRGSSSWHPERATPSPDVLVRHLPPPPPSQLPRATELVSKAPLPVSAPHQPSSVGGGGTIGPPVRAGRTLRVRAA